ncbi:MAG: hypothetical protein ACRCR4_03930 [Thiotrichaceae bacterium]|jgi:hypothetical protein|uniref:Uncharacterized protein n=1 Tax=Candidatus Thiocaldithrix dubininis TaxID=3080823 RepID=A0AA95KIW1_9GAMM|nr:MAG: hypothetical protein QJT80_09175 [Candidatus Thiocaldithrix dubininis]
MQNLIVLLPTLLFASFAAVLVWFCTKRSKANGGLCQSLKQANNYPQD